jgi:hypothetical protein
MRIWLERTTGVLVRHAGGSAWAIASACNLSHVDVDRGSIDFFAAFAPRGGL